ncbi:hypothetical protein [Clostridium sp. HBUAS56017]|uniref:hypothetical protein n=1 Tax=Clostridium sp. HBUAS56017 TaxID=2571128 RepID=UPI001177F29D|nr:hypothetical protein [Clostridium sp. HBUAS56017]
MKIQTCKTLNIIFIVFIIILIIYIITINLRKKDSINVSNSSTTNITYDANNTYDRIDTILKNLNYNYIYTYEKFSTIYLSIGEYSDSNFSITEHKVNDGDLLNVNVKSNRSFLVSLPGNRTWTLVNSNSLKNIILDHNSSIVDWKNTNPDDHTTGIRYHRDNFYFSTKSNGIETLQFKYPDGFTVNINITIS